MAFRVPSSSVCYELEEKRSRFIAFLEPVSSRQEAMDFLATLRTRYPDASHHCWSYVIGDPHSPLALACSDDGEPSGSAGKPILQILQYRALGDVMAVVVRYFGGTKLGVGGLVRAYGASVQKAVEQAELIEQVKKQKVEIVCDYPEEANVRHLIAQALGEIIDSAYSERVNLMCHFAEAQTEALTDAIKNLTQGRAEIKVLD
jgi:uncharacterized YigZ family protein